MIWSFSVRKWIITRSSKPIAPALVYVQLVACLRSKTLAHHSVDIMYLILFISGFTDEEAGGSKPPEMKSNGLLKKVIANGSTGNTSMSNGVPGLKLNQFKPSRQPITETADEVIEMETEMNERHVTHQCKSRHLTSGKVNHVMLQTLLDIKQELMKEVDSLNHRMYRLDDQIDVFVKALQQPEMPVTPPTKFLTETDEPSAITSPETNSTGSGSTTSLRGKNKLTKLTKSSRVSPAQLPALKATSSPTRSQTRSRPPTVGSGSAAPSDSIISGMTVTTTVDVSQRFSENSQRKDKMTNLDML